jgi:glycine cleavage system H protein
MDPTEMRFAKTHEWVHVDGNRATIGITEFAVKQLTDLVYVELPDVGSTLEAGEPFGVVESVKAASDLYAPVSGNVVERNDPLEDDLAILSDDAFGKGWMVKVELEDASQVDALMDHAAYVEHCKNEDH